MVLCRGYRSDFCGTVALACADGGGATAEGDCAHKSNVYSPKYVSLVPLRIAYCLLPIASHLLPPRSRCLKIPLEFLFPLLILFFLLSFFDFSVGGGGVHFASKQESESG
jgi:hypothetical protein